MSDVPSEPPDDLFDPERFDATFPVWVLFLASEANSNGSFSPRACLNQGFREAHEERIFLPIFTDWDLALRCIMKSGHKNCGIPVGRAMLLTLLKSQMALGLQFVCFDPGEKHVRLVPVAEFIAELEGG